MDGGRLTGYTELFIYLFIYLCIYFLLYQPSRCPRLPASAPGSNIHLAWCIPGHWNFNVICGRIQMASSRINAARWQSWCQRPDAQQHPALTPLLPTFHPFFFHSFSFLLLPFSDHCTLKTIIAAHTHTSTCCHSTHISPLPDIDALPPVDCTERRRHSACRYQPCNLLFSTFALSSPHCPVSFPRCLSRLTSLHSQLHLAPWLCSYPSSFAPRLPCILATPLVRSDVIH